MSSLAATLPGPIPTTPPDAGEAGRLAALGAHDDLLTDADRAAIDRDGYVIWPDVIDAPWRERLRQRMDALMDKESSADVSVPGRDGEFQREPGCLRLADLVNKGEEFDAVWQHPRVLAAARHIIGRPVKLSALSAREGKAGGGHQKLHFDWGTDRDGRNHVVNSLWLIDDMDEENGATRVVPGSHRRPVQDLMSLCDRTARHPDEISILAPAGTVVVYNALLWHGGATNTSGRRRRMLHSYFCAREHRQQLDQAAYLRERTAQRLSPAARWLLDV